MIGSIQFKNFKVLRNCVLPLSRFTLIVGPNGSGKSTVFQAMLANLALDKIALANVIPATLGQRPELLVEVRFNSPDGNLMLDWASNISNGTHGIRKELRNTREMSTALWQARVYSLEAHRISDPVQLKTKMELESDGFGLAVVLDRLRDEHPERFEAVNEELGKWIPEFDRILFDTLDSPTGGRRAIALRTRSGHKIKAADISHGTLIALAILTIAYLPSPPPIVGFEEPDRGLHPRLLRDVRDALYRLAYPDQFGEKREPVQVIATTHSPYLLDLFRDHPEEIVIAQKLEDNVRFERLSDRADLDEILKDAHLGDVWYSGILGGVPDRQ